MEEMERSGLISHTAECHNGMRLHACQWCGPMGACRCWKELAREPTPVAPHNWLSGVRICPRASYLADEKTRWFLKLSSFSESVPIKVLRLPVLGWWKNPNVIFCCFTPFINKIFSRYVTSLIRSVLTLLILNCLFAQTQTQLHWFIFLVIY